ncbi:MAG TPA: response regulator [Xanthobacteraceae bacterium]|nr:response regulator [Xanthobacteraceae bacterium]
MQRTISMLIADDSQVSQQILAEAARTSKLPLRITMTDNGRECLTLLNGANIDLAFIDVHMPELSGTEAFWSARKQGIQTFVTLMSNPPAAEAVEMAIKLRAYEFLFKPFAASDALGVMRTYARISSPTKILIVDDSSAVRQIVQKVLHGSVFNCTISEAGDGESALSLARSTKFDAVFLDRNMPGLDGLSTMKRIRVIEPSLKIVMMSAEHDLTKEREALDGGACASLRKPFHSADVDRVLHHAFGLRSPHLKVNKSEQDFDVAIEGSTIRLAHKNSGHIFEYLWSHTPPYLRNAVVRCASACAIAPGRVAPVAQETALLQLRTAQLLAA